MQMTQLYLLCLHGAQNKIINAFRNTEMAENASRTALNNTRKALGAIQDESYKKAADLLLKASKHRFISFANILKSGINSATSAVLGATANLLTGIMQYK